MGPHRGRRLLVTVLLLSGLAGMLVHYGAVGSEAGHDPAEVGDRQLAAYDDHVGEPLYFWARVVATDGEGFVAVSGDQRVRVVGGGATPAPGDVVQVAGVAEANRVVAAEAVVVSPQRHLQYLYAVSGVGALLSAVAFLRSWTVDWRGLAFVPREGPE